MALPPPPPGRGGGGHRRGQNAKKSFLKEIYPFLYPGTCEKNRMHGYVVYEAHYQNCEIHDPRVRGSDPRVMANMAI